MRVPPTDNNPALSTAVMPRNTLLKQQQHLPSRPSTAAIPSQLQRPSSATLSPDILLRIFSHLPIPSLTRLACTSRRFKVLVYNDDIYLEKLLVMGFPLPTTTTNNPSPKSEHSPDDSLSAAAAALSLSSASTFASKSQSFSLNASTLSSSLGRQAVPRGVAREAFIRVYSELAPYYFDFRKRNKSPILFRDFPNPVDSAKILSSLVRFGRVPLVDDYRTINAAIENTVQYAENSSLHQFEKAYDEKNYPEMKKHATALIELNGGQQCLQVFTQKHPVFFENSFNPLDNMKTLSMPAHLRDASNENAPYAPLKKFFKYLLKSFKEQSTVIGNVFPEEADVLYYFTERVFEDVITEYLQKLLDETHDRDIPMYLRTMTVVFQYCANLIDSLGDMKPVRVERSRGSKLMYRIFEPFTNLYLNEELQYVESACKNAIAQKRRELQALRNQTTSSSAATPTSISTQDAESYKRSVLSSVHQILELTTTFIPRSTATSRQALNSTSDLTSPPSLATGNEMEGLPSAASSSNASSESTSFPVSDSNLHPALFQNDPSTSLSDAPVPATSASSLVFAKARENLKVEKEVLEAKFDKMDQLLSLELALKLIHLNRDAIRRAAFFVDCPTEFTAKGDVWVEIAIPPCCLQLFLQLFDFLFFLVFEGKKTYLRTRFKKGIEMIFIVLLRSLSLKHIKPAFDQAIEEMEKYNPAANKKAATGSPRQQRSQVQQQQQQPPQHTVEPLLGFFELVQIADLIQQMVQVYYTEEVCRYVDEHDFFNEANKEKKAFENALDDYAAAGMDKSIQVLMDTVSYFLSAEQKSTDYRPPDDAIPANLNPTRACQTVISCLREHTNAVVGRTDKNIVEVFMGEIGVRFFGVLCKHLKTFRVSETGGWQLISDLNAYHSWATTLRNPDVTLHFTALKELGNLFIVPPDACRELVHDMERYRGIIRVEDMMEFAEMRADYRKLKLTTRTDECSLM